MTEHNNIDRVRGGHTVDPSPTDGLSRGPRGAALRDRLRNTAAPLVVCGVVALVGAACVPNPGGPTTTTSSTTSTTTTTALPWLAAGCYANNVLPLLLGSVQFNGDENQLGNALQHFTTDGTCTSGSPSVETIVRSPNATSALAVCNGLGSPETFTSVSNLATNGWTVPADAWFCQTPIFP